MRHRRYDDSMVFAVDNRQFWGEEMKKLLFFITMLVLLCASSVYAQTTDYSGDGSAAFGGFLVLLMIMYPICIIAVAVWAENLGRGAFAWGVIAFLITPLLAGIMLGCVGKVNK